MIPNRVHISKRPVEYGLIHTEGDTAVSPKKSGSKHAAAFVTEISSKLLLGARTKNLQPSVVSKAMKKSMVNLNADTMTLDNGIENKRHKDIGIPTFFCDPHAPWQKPHIETNIGLLRRWFVPKGTDWRTVSERKLQKYLYSINSKYRKSLGYKSSYEVAYEKGILKTLPEGVAFE